MSNVGVFNKKYYFWVLFLYEALLKLSINVIQISLVFYVINILNQTTELAYEWLAFFGVTLYSMPIIIGTLVDEAIGLEKSIKSGAILLLLGATSLFLKQKELFIFGVVSLALGSSLFKPNLVVLLDKMFPQRNFIRNKYFSYFYLSSNVGSILSTIIVGILVQFFKLKDTLIISQLSLILLAVVFFFFHSSLKPYYSSKKIKEIKFRSVYNKKNILIIAALLMAIHLKSAVIILMVSFSILIKLGLNYKNSGKKNNKENYKLTMIRVLVVVLYAIVFFSLTSQVYYSFNLFLKHFVDRSITNSINIPVAWFFSINPILVLTLGGVISKNIKKVNLVNRMLTSLILVMIAYTLFCISTFFGVEKAELFYVFSAFVLLVIAEIITIPHLISEITYNIPANFKSRVVGLWYLTMAFAQYIASKIALFICSDISSTSLKDFSIPLIKITILANLIICIFIFVRKKIKSKTIPL